MLTARVQRIVIVGNPSLVVQPRAKWQSALCMTPEVKGYARNVIAKIETERTLPANSICSRIQRHLIVEARYDAMVEVYLHFLGKGQRLSLSQLGEIFNLHFNTVRYALQKRGVVDE